MHVELFSAIRGLPVNTLGDCYGKELHVGLASRIRSPQQLTEVLACGTASVTIFLARRRDLWLVVCTEQQIEPFGQHIFHRAALLRRK